MEGSVAKWNRRRKKLDRRLSGSDRDSEQTCNECGLPKDVILWQPPDLSLADHVHRFNTPDRPPRRVKRSETLTGSHPPFDCLMILLHHIAANRDVCAAYGFCPPMLRIQMAVLRGQQFA
jgi:hypothetical protein